MGGGAAAFDLRGTAPSAIRRKLLLINDNGEFECQFPIVTAWRVDRGAVRSSVGQVEAPGNLAGAPPCLEYPRKTATRATQRCTVDPPSEFQRQI